MNSLFHMQFNFDFSCTKVEICEIFSKSSSLFTKHQLFSNVQFLQNQFPLQDNVEYDNSDEGVVAISKENLRIVAGCD